MFTPIIQTSTDINNDLSNVANARGISSDSVDFDLINYKTYYKNSSHDEWQVLDNINLLSVATETEIRSKLFSLTQEYQIRIREYTQHPYMDLRIHIACDKYKSKAVAIIDSSSTIPLKKGVQDWIKDAIIKKQLRHGLLIGLYEQNLDKEINRLLLKIQKEGPLRESYRFAIGDFFPPTLPSDDKIIPHFKHNREGKSLIEGVEPGELILEYVFAKHGRDGRNCEGKFIEVPEPTSRYASYIVINDDTIEAEEDQESIRFYAKVSGFVERKKGIFTISQELRIDKADFKGTGSIETGIDKEISLKIKHHNAIDDSVGTGVNIDVQRLDVQGTIGSHATIQACEVNIGAQTHKNSHIHVTENATIHLHRGNLKAKEATIDVLETGKIEADTVHVHKMVGGEIIANTVHIDVLYSNAKIVALKSITIGTIEGEGNKLIIDPHAIESYHEQIAQKEHEIKEHTSLIQLQSKELVAKQISFKDKSNRMKQIQQRVLLAKQNGTEAMKADLIRLQQYKIEAQELKSFADTIQSEENHLHHLKDEVERLYEADLHATIVHHGTYNGKNRILFKDPKTHQEYGITPDGKITTIFLRKIGDDKKIILES